jgi:hypothetical protein
VDGRKVLVKRVLAVALVTLASVASSHAQSFGRNKVRYENFDFQILETPHFDIYYDAAEHDAVVQAGRLAERWYARLSQVLDHTFTERQPIVLYASHAQFTQTNVIPGMLSDGIGGVTEHEKGRVVLRCRRPRQTDHVLKHELVHAFSGHPGDWRRSRRCRSVRGRMANISPSAGSIRAAMWLRDWSSRMPPRLDQLDDPAFFLSIRPAL